MMAKRVEGTIIVISIVVAVTVFVVFACLDRNWHQEEFRPYYDVRAMTDALIAFAFWHGGRLPLSMEELENDGRVMPLSDGYSYCIYPIELPFLDRDDGWTIQDVRHLKIAFGTNPSQITIEGEKVLDSSGRELFLIDSSYRNNEDQRLADSVSSCNLKLARWMLRAASSGAGTRLFEQVSADVDR